MAQGRTAWCCVPVVVLAVLVRQLVPLASTRNKTMVDEDTWVSAASAEPQGDTWAPPRNAQLMTRGDTCASPCNARNMMSRGVHLAV